MARKRSTEQEDQDVPNIPTRTAPTPDPKVPSPKPAPATITAPHFAAGVVAEVRAHGSAVDPFTGRTVTAADL